MNLETGLRARPGAHHLFRDRSLLVVRPEGEADGRGLEGFFYANTRVLSRFALRVDGRAMDTVQVHPVTDSLLVAYYQDVSVTDDAVLQDRALTVQLTIALGEGFHVDIEARNHSLMPVACDLTLELDADFADTEETRAGMDASKILLPNPERTPQRLQQAPVRRVCGLERDGTLRFLYDHPRLQEAVRLRFSTPPGCTADGVRWRLQLAPQEEWRTCIDITPTHEGIERTLSVRCHGAEARDRDRGSAWLESATRLKSRNDSVRRSYERGVQDLAALAQEEGPPAERPAFAAGIPIYHNRFGRDLLTTGWQAALATPALLKSAILVCERYQGRVRDDFRDEQPGRIMQQVRSGPLNQLDLNPRARCYSDYASPPDFLIMLGQYFMWTGDREFLAAHLPAAKRVLRWLDSDADLDGDGFYEYQTRSSMGDRNQGWKDSEHAIPHADGADAALPVATCEVQSYVYAGKQQLAIAMLALGHVREAMHLLRQAAELKKRFNQAFWLAEDGLLALALDGEKRPVRSVSSNTGQCLAAGIVDAAHAPAVAARLMAPDMFSGWGIRTLSAEHPAYNPFSYHLGCVWTIEQGSIAFGMKRYGFSEYTNAIARGTFDFAERCALHRLPEAIGGYQRNARHPLPGFYPQACWPQAWSASSVIQLIQAMLGLRPIAPLGMLLIDPDLPEWLPDVTLRGLRVGSSTLTLHFRRGKDGHTEHRVLERDGVVRVLHQPPESSVRASWLSRVTDPLLGVIGDGW